MLGNRMTYLYELASQFRKAIESAHAKGHFTHDNRFDDFPVGCCGDTCYLLAEYLSRFGIETVWYSADRNGWSHAWLVVKDARVKKPAQRFLEAPDNIRDILNMYSGGQYKDSVDITRYERSDLQYGLIIDITGDQFEEYDFPVYVGSMDYFHKSFEFNQAYDYKGLNDRRLLSLYKTILAEM